MPGRGADSCFALSCPCVLSFPPAKSQLKREFHAAQHRTGLQMPFPGFDPDNRCGNPVAVHAPSPRDGFFHQTCCIFRDQIPAGMEPCPSLCPCRAPLWYFTVNPKPFVKPQQILYRPEILCGGRSLLPLGMSRRVFFPEFSSRSFLPGVSSR